MKNRIIQYRSELAACRETIFRPDVAPLWPREAVYAYSGAVDALVREIHETTIAAGAPGEKVSLIALGGYGRRELCPYSDVDMLVLHEEGRATEAIAAAVRHFWDMGMNMGCVVRTIRSCQAIMGDDFATDTALLENRYLAGNEDLFEKFQDTVVLPYFHKEKKSYLEEIVRSFREGLYSPEKSIYHVEPDLKNGICCLRDCQRLLWAEQVRSGARSFPDLHLKSRFTSLQASRLEADYALLLRLRIALHRVCGHRMDVLETALQPLVAEACGFGVHGAGKMMEQFYKAVRRIRLLLLSFLEKDLSGRNIWQNVRKRVSANALGPGTAVLDGIMFSTKSADARIGKPGWLMDVFQQTLVHRATLSVELRNRIRHFASHLDKKEFKSQAISDAFRDLLMSKEPIGKTIQMMHETKILERLIPQFHGLTCKVEYDSYHEYTIDQHILLALQTAEDMAFDPDGKIRRLYRGLKRPHLLRLALLLHDIGKARKGDHAHGGAIIAENVCQRLGLREEEAERVRFLVQHHLDMSYLSLQREPEDHHIQQFAQTLQDRETLDRLYLLTIADIRSVGQRTWTQWKAFQLEQLYDRTRSVLNQSGRETLTEIPGVPPADLDGTVIPDESYFQGTLPEERRRHQQWLAAVDVTDMLLYNEPFPGFERLTVCGHDRVGFLGDIIGCVSSEGYNILSARVYSTTDGKALDIFNLEPPSNPRLNAPVRIQNIYKKWRLLTGGEITADAMVLERIRKYPPAPLRIASPLPPVHIHVDNRVSALYTVLEIDMPDNFGLLHKIARCLGEQEINIVSARLSTRIDQAVDVFYITDRQRRKLTNTRQIDGLKRRLLKALAA